jgi:mxaA protein
MVPDRPPVRQTWRIVAIAALIAASVAGTAVAAADTAPATDAVVEQPRPFGHVVGDVLEQRVLLQIAGRDFAPAALPRAERLGVWLERRTAELATSADGRRWLVVPYQLINAPQTLTAVSLPAWEIKSKSGEATLKIAEWPLTVAPLTLRFASGAGSLDDLLPDHTAPLVATEPIRRRFLIGLCSCILILAAWLGWLVWRNHRAAANQPFARALRDLRNSADGSAQSWQILHRAFDATAGHVVRYATLDNLFERAPQLEALRADIEQFFTQSAALFFADVPPQNPLPLQAFCRVLRRLEKRHER